MLVTVQVAVCLVLLLSAGLLSRGLYRAHTIDPGLAMEDVSVLNYGLQAAGYEEASAATFQQRLIERLAAVPGVRGVAQASPMPLSGAHHETQLRPSREPIASMYMEFSLGHAGVLRPARHSHRPRPELHKAADIESESGVIVTESTARRLWPGDDPLTKALTLDKTKPQPIVGVVRDAQLSRLGVTERRLRVPPGRSVVATAHAAAGRGNWRQHESTRAARGGGRARSAPRGERHPARRQPRAVARAVEAGVGARGNARGARALLACTGVFGTVAYTVSRRVREIGIRVALGAARDDVLRLIVRQGMRPVVIGIGDRPGRRRGGIDDPGEHVVRAEPARSALVRADPAASSSRIALAACYVPARRALRVDPTTALRTD